MPKFVVTYRGTVYPWQCSHMGHMNVMWYVGMFDEASWQLLSALGLSASRLREANAGMAAVEQHIEYRREVHAGDITTVRSTVLDITEKALRLLHEMRNDSTDKVVAVTKTTGVYFDASLRKARRLPSDVRIVAERMISSDDAKSEAFMPSVSDRLAEQAPVKQKDSAGDCSTLFS
jgi:acyl-CoA thioester hydrolase